MRADREYRVPAKSLLRSGSNTISIIIQPAITEAAARADACPYDVPAQQVDPWLEMLLSASIFVQLVDAT